MSRSGFTLIELIVVLVIMVMAAGIVAPALMTRQPESAPALTALIGRAQDIAAGREETVYLGISASGNWRLDAGGTETQPLATGDLPGYQGPRATLLVSPLGTCGFDVHSSDAARRIPIDPLTCQVVSP